MAQFKFDDEVVSQAIADLRTLQEECEENKKKKKPSSKYDKGMTHDSLNALRKEIKNSWTQMNQLIEQTIEFLGGAQNTFNTSDQQSAAAINKGGV